MKTLILNGSPRKKGDTATLIEALKKQLKGEVYLINAYEDSIAPCIDCRYCWKHDGCAIEDHMEKMYEWLRVADCFVIGSPLYFSELTGPTLSVISRLQRFYGAQYIRKDPHFYLKPKQGALLLAGGGSTKQYERVMETVQLIFRHVNTKMVGCAIAAQTDQVPASQDQSALNEVRKIALLFNKQHQEG